MQSRALLVKPEGSGVAAGDRHELPRLDHEVDTVRPLPGEDAYGGKTVMRAVPSEILLAAGREREAPAVAPKIIIQPDDYVPAPPQVPSDLRPPMDALLEQLDTEVSATARTATPEELANNVHVSQAGSDRGAEPTSAAAPTASAVVVTPLATASGLAAEARRLQPSASESTGVRAAPVAISRVQMMLVWMLWLTAAILAAYFLTR